MSKILLAVDVQKDFIDGSLAVPGAEAILPAIESIKDRFDYVYFTLDWHPVNHCSFKEQGGPWPPHCVHFTCGASLPESLLAGIPEDRMRFILKGQMPEREEYGAFAFLTEEEEDYFFGKDDEVTVCGIAAEYCVLETLKNLHRISLRRGFRINVFLDGVASFETPATPLLDFMKEADIKAFGK